MNGHDSHQDVRDQRTRVLADAAGALAVHVDDGGFCRGCLTVRGRLVEFPCTRVVWARSVQASLVADRVAFPDRVTDQP